MTWIWDASHFPRRVTAAMVDVYCDAAEAGFARGAATFGLVTTGWHVRAFDGLIHTRPAEDIGASSIQVREAAAATAIRERRWLAVADRWRATERPVLVEELRRLGDVNLEHLDDTGAAEHLLAIAARARDGVARHFELHLTDMIPFGRLALAARAASVAPSEVVARTEGLSPSSRFTTDLPPAAVVGRLDVDAPCVQEISSTALRPVERMDCAPPTYWGEPTLDNLLDEVAQTFWIRDDNSALLMSVPIGLLRLALLDTGRRLDLDPHLIVEATADEAASMLRSKVGPTPEVLGVRADERSRTDPSVKFDSDVEGVDPSRHTRAGPHSLELSAALDACDELFEAEGTHGVGSTIIRGIAVVAYTPDEAIEHLEPGSILVVRTTSPSADPTLASAAALVCELGGPLSHAAIGARETGISAVFGLEGMTQMIRSGDMVEVDPTRKTVRVLH